MNDIHRLIGGVLLVAGTTIGAGMLALPVATGLAGFVPSIVLFIGYWLYMTFTAFLMLEVNLWMGEQTNLITMARQTLGKGGQILSWIVYLFLLYSLTTAYIAGSGPIFIDFIYSLTGWQMPVWASPFPLLLIFGFFVYKGARSVDYANRLLMLGLVITYILMVGFLMPDVQMDLLQQANWAALGIAVSIVSTSFGFHIIIPTLTDYLHRDVRQIRQVIWIGSLVPLLVYISWELIALGIVPLYGENGLVAGYQKGLDGATLLSHLLGRSELSLLARFFSLFAIVTSFLGVSLSLRDFLADGLNIQKTRKGRLILYLLSFAPPLLLTLIDPRAFLNALEYAGAFGVVTLLGLFPVLMVWRGRYIQHRLSSFKVPGGKLALGLAFVVSLTVITLEVVNKGGWIVNKPHLETVHNRK
ncbi:amino acid permease [Candidatus Protochlamydia phocaeensis]|uniref:amino acid permease n=1 Tax=Candidatus Protochlamydia phocaeensis TaxID=1414722 RepID=UPI0008395C39|nr:aromatic amino acid transport family protein [Candidatus Protochlamydia phocaeensis]